MVSQDALSQITRAEIDTQVATARKHGRSIREFLRKAKEMATLDEEIAASCMYCLPRGGKKIEGPSARLAEIVAVAWTNLRSGARVISMDKSFLTAQGFAHDLESNVATTIEVQRRITDSKGRRYNDDMIVVTGNAASSIALRNAVFKIVPKAYWSQVYAAARATAIGDAKTLVSRRQAAVDYFAKMGVSLQQILDVLGRRGLDDVTLDDIAILAGIKTAIKDGDTTIENAFTPKQDAEQKAGLPNGRQSIRPNGNGSKSEDMSEPASVPKKKHRPADRDAFVDELMKEVKASTDDDVREALLNEARAAEQLIGPENLDLITETIAAMRTPAKKEQDPEQLVDRLKNAIRATKDTKKLAELREETQSYGQLIDAKTMEYLLSLIDARLKK